MRWEYLMKIMAIADHESELLWDYFDKSYLEGIDLILSCGDLKPQYLSFLATFTQAPVLYVHGNHDDRYEETPPDGCICIEDTIYWGLADPCAISPALISIPSLKCAGGCGSSGGN